MPAPVTTITASSGRVVSPVVGSLPIEQYVTAGNTVQIRVSGAPANAVIQAFDFTDAKVAAIGYTQHPTDAISWVVPNVPGVREIGIKVKIPGQPDPEATRYKLQVRPYVPNVTPPPPPVVVTPAPTPAPTPPTPAPPIVVEAPTPAPAPDNTPPRFVIRGTIVEDGTAYDTARTAGFTLFREWCSVNWSTGQINDPKDVPRCNALIAKGYGVILTVTPDEASNRTGDRCKDFSVVADQLIAAGLDHRVIVQLVNEANLTKNGIGTYWPDGNVVDATKLFAVPVGVKLKAAGYTLACPSITYNSPVGIVDFVGDIFANSPADLWTYIDGHCYPSDLNTFKVVMQTYATVGKFHGVKVMSSEWSHKVGNAAFALELPKFLAVADACCDMHCWFSWTYGAKFNPLNPYGWRDGLVSPVGAAWAQALKAAT